MAEQDKKIADLELQIEFYKNEIKKCNKVNIELTEQLRIGSVMFELPETKEVETRLKHVVDKSFEDYEAVEKMEYSLGFRACFNWLKIKQMKSKGN